MLTKQQEQEVISILDNEFDVQDVYFTKGKLFVINAYDVPAVEDFQEMYTSYHFAYQYVEDDVYVY